MNSDAVYAVLDTIVDPCSAAMGVPAGIVTMGLVRRVDISQSPDGAHVEVNLRVTEPTCLMGGPFTNEARLKLGQLDDVAQVIVNLDSTPDWMPEDMSPEYRVRLAAHRSRLQVRYASAQSNPKDQSAPTSKVEPG